MCQTNLGMRHQELSILTKKKEEARTVIQQSQMVNSDLFSPALCTVSQTNLQLIFSC